MALVAGTATVSADDLGNITLGGSDMALAIATASKPVYTQAAILKMKAFYDPTTFQSALNSIYVDQANNLAAALAPYIQNNI